MRRSVHLPSYLVSGENETSLSSPDYKHCEFDVDCQGSMICYKIKNFTWLKGKDYENLDFYQHDNTIGSLNYIKFIQKPEYNFCGCPVIGGWNGFVIYFLFMFNFQQHFSSLNCQYNLTNTSIYLFKVDMTALIFMKVTIWRW